jgi:hypothetical protein
MHPGFAGDPGDMLVAGFGFWQYRPGGGSCFAGIALMGEKEDDA